MSTPSVESALRELRKSSKSRKNGPDLTKMHLLHGLVLLFLPTLLFWITLNSINDTWPLWFESCKPWGDPGQLQTNPSTCIFKDTLEKPNPILYLPLLIATAYALVNHRNSPEKLKRFTFGLHFLTTFVIRCLSSFSGWMTLPSYHFLLFNSNSPGKAFWLMLLIGLWFWDWTYLGTYADVHFDEVSYPPGFAPL